MVTKSSKNNLFKVEQIFGSKTRARLLSLFVHNPDRQFFVRELTRKIDAQLNSVRRELKNLIGIGIIDEVENNGEKGKHVEKKKYYQANKSFPLFQDMRSLLKKVQLMAKQNLVQEIDEKGKVDLLLLTGRFVDSDDVPVDMLVVGSISHAALQKLLQAFETEFGQEVNFTMMPKEEFLYRKEVSDRFLYTILQSEHISMIDRLS